MKHILLVDDSPTVIEAAYDELDEQGYMVDVAYNGKLAVKLMAEYAADELPDLIVMDIEMPQMRGDEAAKIIRDNPAWKHVPIVALTGVAPDNLADSLGLFDNYLVKPFGFEQMLNLIVKMIGPAD